MELKMALIGSGLVLLLNGCASQSLADRARLRDSVDKQRIATQLKQQRRVFEGCGHAYGGDSLSGTLTVRFKIRSNGSTSNPHIFESIGQSAALDHCLTDAALQLVFDPMPKGVVAEVKYPLQFHGTREPAGLRSEPAQDPLPE
ncbi:MAG: energy transducer TonB [Deltaproteobacteria bacterium]|nr:energy transducer TonB [Deltaproteobacteria bacterium]